MDFYQKVSIVDRLKEIKMISGEDVNQLITLISEESVRKYFFANLKNPSWFLPLQELGLFSNPPSPIAESGATRVPKWEVMDYLLEIAIVYPEEVTNIIESIPPINSIVIWDCVKIGKLLPAAYTSRLVHQVPKWLNAQYFSITNVGIEIGTWVEHLTAGKQIVSALLLLRILITPRRKNYSFPEMEGFSERRRVEAIPPIDSYGFEQLLGVRLLALAEEAPFEVAATLEQALRSAIEMESHANLENDWSSLWRPAIEDHSQNWGFRQFKDLVTVALRDVVQKCADRDADKARNYLEYLLSLKHSIFNRVALHGVRMNKDKFFGLGRDFLLDMDNYSNNQIHHECLLLLGEWFSSLAEHDREDILNKLFNHPDEDAVDRDAKPEIQKKQLIYWSVARLEVIKDYLSASAKETFEALASQVGPIEHPTFLSYHEASWGEASPKTTKELSELSSEEVVQYLKDFKPKPGFREPTPRGLAQTFSIDFKERPDDYLRLADEFLMKMRPAYLYVFVESLEEIRNRGKQFDWDLTLGLFSRFILLQDSPTGDDSEDSDWNYASVRRRIADLVTVWLKHDKPGHLPFEFKEQAWDIVKWLCHDVEPDEEHEEKFGGSNMNPPTLCINTTRGKAMHALFEYALWYAFYTKDRMPQEGDVDRFDPKVRELLNEKLDKGKDPSEAVHSSFGQFLGNLYYLNKRWLIESIPSIFPSDPRYWKAAWGTYISFSRIYPALYELLKNEYLRAISSLPDDSIFLDHSALSPERGLAEHLMVAYLNDLDSLDDGSRIDLFFKKANDHQKAEAIGFTGEVGSREKLFNEPDKWKKAVDLWKLRLMKATTEEEKHPHQEEFTAFLGWADGFADPLSRLYEPIRLSISLCKPHWRVDSLLKYICKNAGEDGNEAIDLLDRLMQSLGEEGQFWHIEETREILGLCIKSKESNVRRKTIELINRFGEWGRYEYRDLLPSVSEQQSLG